MKIISPLFLIIVLLLAACTTVEVEVNPRINNKVAADANTQLGIAYLREGNYEMARAFET